MCDDQIAMLNAFVAHVYCICCLNDHSSTGDPMYYCAIFTFYMYILCFLHRKTEELLEQFNYHLAEVNNSIKEHTEQINNATMNIIQNEEKISKLIATL